jgi:hypothetical protein
VGCPVPLLLYFRGAVPKVPVLRVWSRACEFHPGLGNFGFLSCVAKNVGQKSGAAPVSRSDEYRRFAAECLKIREVAEDEQQRAIFLQMATAWLALAQKDETSADHHQSPDDEIN